MTLNLTVPFFAPRTTVSHLRTPATPYLHSERASAQSRHARRGWRRTARSRRQLNRLCFPARTVAEKHNNPTDSSRRIIKLHPKSRLNRPDRLAPLSMQNGGADMIYNPHSGGPLSLQELKRLGDKQIVEAHRAVTDSRRIALEVTELHAETQRLHDRFHGGTSEQSNS